MARKIGPNVDLLPQIPEIDLFNCEDGYAWVRKVENTEWRISNEIGTWPLTALATIKVDTEHGPLWGVATFTEGDVTVQSFTDHEEYKADLVKTVEFWHVD